MFYVYLIQNEQKKFYIGSTNNLKRRFKEHNDGKNVSTRSHDWKLVYYEAYTTMNAARDREKKLKHDGRVRRFLMERIKTHLE